MLGAREKRIWLAEGEIKPAVSYRQRDDLSLNSVRDAMHVHDLQATLLHLPGVDRENLTYRFQRRRFRLTDVHGKVLRGILA